MSTDGETKRLDVDITATNSIAKLQLHIEGILRLYRLLLDVITGRSSAVGDGTDSGTVLHGWVMFDR